MLWQLWAILNLLCTALYRPEKISIRVAKATQKLSSVILLQSQPTGEVKENKSVVYNFVSF